MEYWTLVLTLSLLLPVVEGTHMKACDMDSPQKTVLASISGIAHASFCVEMYPQPKNFAQINGASQYCLAHQLCADRFIWWWELSDPENEVYTILFQARDVLREGGGDFTITIFNNDFKTSLTFTAAVPDITDGHADNFKPMPDLVACGDPQLRMSVRCPSGWYPVGGGLCLMGDVGHRVAYDVADDVCAQFGADLAPAAPRPDDDRYDDDEEDEYDEDEDEDEDDDDGGFWGRRKKRSLFGFLEDEEALEEEKEDGDDDGVDFEKEFGDIDEDEDDEDEFDPDFDLDEYDEDDDFDDFDDDEYDVDERDVTDEDGDDKVDFEKEFGEDAFDEGDDDDEEDFDDDEFDDDEEEKYDEEDDDMFDDDDDDYNEDEEDDDFYGEDDEDDEEEDEYDFDQDDDLDVEKDKPWEGDDEDDDDEDDDYLDEDEDEDDDDNDDEYDPWSGVYDDDDEDEDDNDSTYDFNKDDDLEDGEYYDYDDDEDEYDPEPMDFGDWDEEDQLALDTCLNARLRVLAGFEDIWIDSEGEENCFTYNYDDDAETEEDTCFYEYFNFACLFNYTLYRKPAVTNFNMRLQPAGGKKAVDLHVHTDGTVYGGIGSDVESVTMTCEGDGFPQPEAVIVQVGGGSGTSDIVALHSSPFTHKLADIEGNFLGRFSCVAGNAFGEEDAIRDVLLLRNEVSSYAKFVAPGAVILVLLVLTTALILLVAAKRTKFFQTCWSRRRPAGAAQVPTEMFPPNLDYVYGGDGGDEWAEDDIPLYERRSRERQKKAENSDVVYKELKDQRV